MQCSVAISEIKENLADTGLFFDIDGTLSPIASAAEQAEVPQATQQLLKQLASKAACVVCISGRRALEAAELVAIPEILYIGLHGAETLPLGSKDPVLLSELGKWQSRVNDFLKQINPSELAELGITVENKSAIVALHWRMAANQQLAVAAIEQIAAEAEKTGLHIHRGRKVLELRPPVDFDKGQALTRVVTDQKLNRALYCGDDRTDIYALKAVKKLVREEKLQQGVAIAVESDETPPGLVEASDFSVQGTTGVTDLLQQLL